MTFDGPQKPLVSVLIPCFNAEKYVGEAVESALTQTHANVEVVVVDDGSEDGSRRVLREFGNRVRVEAASRQGACAARNRALSLSRGEFVQFLDADDVLDRAKIERQLPYLLDARADLVLCHVGLFGDREPRREKKPHPRPAGDPFAYFFAYPIGTAAPLHRRASLEAVGGFRPGLPRMQDADLHLRLAAAGARLSMVEEVLIWVRMHAGARITNNRPEPRFFLDYYTGLAGEVGRAGRWTPARRLLVAREIYRHAIACHVAGEKGAGAAGIAFARRLDPGVRLHERRLFQFLRRTLGPCNTERLLRSARSVRALVKA